MLHCRAHGHAFDRTAHWFKEADLEPGMPELARKDMSCACGTVKTRWMVIKTFRDWGEARYTYPPGFLQTDVEGERAVREDYRAEDLRRDLSQQKNRDLSEQKKKLRRVV